MSDGIFSPDGKFLWTGDEWIPAPPDSHEETYLSKKEKNNNHPSNQPVTRNELFNILAAIVSFSIFLGLLMPYIKIIDINGFQIIHAIFSDEMNPIDFDEDKRLPGTTMTFVESMHYLSVMLFLLSPIIFLITFTTSIIQLSLKNSIRKVFYYHSVYFFCTVMLGIFGLFLSDNTIIDLSLWSMISTGFYVSGFGPLIYILLDINFQSEGNTDIT